MRKLAILILGVMLIMPMVAQDKKSSFIDSIEVVDAIFDWEKGTYIWEGKQEEKAKTEWVIQDTHKLLLQHFHQRYQGRTTWN